MQLRWLYRHDLVQLEPILKARGWMALNHDNAAALAAFDANGTLVGFLCVQHVPHIEPLYVDPAYRGTGLAESLADGVAEALRVTNCRGAFLIANNPASAKLAEKFEMTKIEDPIYFKIDMGGGI